MKKIIFSLAVAGITTLTYSFVKSTKSSTTITHTTIETAGVGTEIGDIAPELKFKNPEGKEIALSSLRGSFVLIDFWASWCGPCRMENPNVVAVYNKFKNKNFKIYSVSLDKSATAWKSAIDKDGLAWPDHVSDLMAWQSEAAMIYGVNSIPVNFLIDPKGVIIDKGLRGSALGASIEKAIANYNPKKN